MRCAILKRLFIAILSIAFAITGCAKKTQETTPQNEIVVWHWLSDRTDAFDELAKQYKEETGVNIKFELYAPTSSYTSKVRAAAQANKLPDVYGILLEQKDFASFVKAGHVADLTSYMKADSEAWESSLYKAGLVMNTFPEGNEYGVKPGIYGVPVDINNIQLIYNLDLLQKAGWDPANIPATWDEFIALGEKLKKANIQGLVSGWGEPWMIHCLADNFAWNIMGKEKVLATIKGEVKYTDPDWVKVFDLFKQMKEHGLLSDGIVTMINKEAEQAFANERAAIAFNGSWCVNVYESMNPALKFAPAMPPKVNKEMPMYIWGGTTSFVVNDRSPMKEDAVKLLKWLTSQKQCAYLADKTNNIPSSKECAGIMKGAVIKFAEGMDNVVHPRLLPVEEYPLVTEAFDKGIQSIIIGEATPEDVAKTVQQTKEREMAKAEKFRALKEKK